MMSENTASESLPPKNEEAALKSTGIEEEELSNISNLPGDQSALKSTGIEEDTANINYLAGNHANDQGFPDNQVKSIAAFEQKPHAREELSEHGDNNDGGDKISFPILLHEIVCDPSTDHCIHWLPNGNLFTISDKKKFAKEVLLKLNGHAKFTSFTRRLKRWGFSRIASGPQIGAYQNPDFVKEDPERLKNIKYMHPKPLSMTAIQRSSAKLQAANAMNSAFGGGTYGVQTMTQDPAVLQTLFAQLKQMGVQMPGQAANPATDTLMRFSANRGHGLAPNNNNLAAMVNNQGAIANNQSMAMQLAMLQVMQNQHKQQQQIQQFNSVAASAVASGTDSANANESFAEKLVRMNPSLAAKLLEATNVNINSLQGNMNPLQGNTNPLQGNTNPLQGNMNPPQGNTNPLQGMRNINVNPLQGMQSNNSSTPNIMSLLAGQNINQMQHNVNPALLQQIGNQREDQNNRAAMMFARMQQEQQQQEQQRQEFIKNFMSGQVNQEHQAPTNNPRNSAHRSSEGSLVTPFSSVPSLQPHDSHK